MDGKAPGRMSTASSSSRTSEGLRLRGEDSGRNAAVARTSVSRRRMGQGAGCFASSLLGWGRGGWGVRVRMCLGGVASGIRRCSGRAPWGISASLLSEDVVCEGDGIDGLVDSMIRDCFMTGRREGSLNGGLQLTKYLTLLNLALT